MGLREKIDPAKARILAKEATRTIPPRKHLSRGTKVWLPVYIPGANFSVGDLYFSQVESFGSTENICNLFVTM